MRVRDVLKFWHPDGIIVDGGCIEHANLRQSEFKDFPAVFCDVPSASMKRPYCGVVHDSSETAALAAKELLSLGLPHYAVVGNIQPCEWSDRRQEVFSSAVAAAGKGVSMFRFEESDDFGLSRKRLRPFLASLPRPCGLLAANDITADVVLRVLKDMRIKVPGEVAVVGIDNDELICENATPSLTSVVPDFEKSGYLAAELLDAMMKGDVHPGMLLSFGSAQVIRRESTRILKRRDDAIRHALEFIRKNARNGISPKDVLGVIGGSRRQAEYRFREYVGKSIGEEIFDVRLGMAKDCLMDPSIPIGSIALRCGYANEASFRRSFRKATGMSLSAFRNAHS